MSKLSLYLTIASIPLSIGCIVLEHMSGDSLWLVLPGYVLGSCISDLIWNSKKSSIVAADPTSPTP